MQRVYAYLAQNAVGAWALIAGTALALAVGVFWLDMELRTQQRQTRLQAEAQRSGLEITSSTLNGNLMGSITLLGLMDGDIKQEASNGLIAEDASTDVTLSIVGNAFGAEGIFIVGQDGIVKTSWDRMQKPSTGLDVRFRPYFQMAMKGQSNVYAAVSMARGDRALYFTAPVFSERARSIAGIGAVVARTSLERVDKLLQGSYDIALLLSPQGVVFTGTKVEWLGRLAGPVTAQRMQEIRERKQFGALFETQTAQELPVSPQQGIQMLERRPYAVAVAPVSWNDPAGDWQLVVLEDLRRTVPQADSAARAVLVALLAFVLGWMGLRMLRLRHAQALATGELQAFAHQQEGLVAFRTQLGQLSLELQHCDSWEQFSTVFFHHARVMAGVVQGALYVALDASRPDSLQLVGSAACATPPPAVLEPGESLLGQAALNRSVQTIPTPPDGIWNLRSGLGGTRLAALVLAPLVMQDQLIGVVEMGLLTLPDAQQQQHLDALLALLTNHLEIHRRTVQLQALSQSTLSSEVPA